MSRETINSCLFHSIALQITSQNPYAEVFVGEPFVQTVNIKNLTEVEEALRKIISTKVNILLSMSLRRE